MPRFWLFRGVIALLILEQLSHDSFVFINIFDDSHEKQNRESPLTYFLLNSLNKLVFFSDLLHLTNDGCNEKRHTVTDLSARISSVLALHQRPASLLHPVVENELSSVRQVHFDDPSGRRSSTAAAAAGTDCDVVEDNTASPTIVAEERPDVDEATHDQLLVADAISTDEARRSVLLHCEQAEPLPFEKVFPPT